MFLTRSKRHLTGTLATLALAVAAPSAAAQAPALTPIGDFASPVHVAAPPQDIHRLFVVEQPGRIQLLVDGQRTDQPFLDIDADVLSGGERGLFSVAFAPDYETSGKLYVYYTDLTGDIRIVEFTRSAESPDRADPASARTLLVQEHRVHANHNGGSLVFGPDGLLYAGIGDGGGGGDPFEAGQNLATLLGKIIRIDPTPSALSPYSIPAGNPFIGRPGARPEIWAYGVRNPWRFSFDRKTGDLLLTDVGQNAWEEVDYAPRGTGSGANYGWDCFEGRVAYSGCEAPGHVPPILVYDHSDGACSITGGYVVRDESLGALAGRYIYGDWCREQLRSAAPAIPDAQGDAPVGVGVPSLTSFGEDPCGRIYVTSGGGRVSRLEGSTPAVCAEPLPPPPPGDKSDLLAPILTLGGRTRQRPLRRRGVELSALCSEPCLLTGSGRVTIAKGKRLKLRRIRFALDPRTPRKVKLKLTRRTRRELPGAFKRKRKLTARLELQATDAVGNRSVAVRQVTLVP